MTPNSVVDLYPSCTIPAPPCPSPSDMRLTSQTFQVPISTSSPTGYIQTVTDMDDTNLIFAELPVNITIIADGCRYNSSMGTTINIYKAYNSAGGLFGGSLSNQLGGTFTPINTPYSIGKVFAIIMDEHTPSNEVFQKYGGWDGLGTVFYLDYPEYKDVSNVKLSDCKIAKNLYPNQKFFPLREELIILFDAPAKETQDNKYKVSKYYLSVLNIWNNPHHNSNPARSTSDIKLGDNFEENPNVNPLLPFEGDSIFEGRNGNSLRFSRTTKYNQRENWWSALGSNLDPITILSNGHANDPESLKPYVENPNFDQSSLILTSFQRVPLSVRNLKKNTIFTINI
jgi:hypothetical protein